MEQDRGEATALPPHSGQNGRPGEDVDVEHADPTSASKSNIESRTEEEFKKESDPASQHLEAKVPKESTESEADELNSTLDSVQIAPTIPIVIETPPESEILANEDGVTAREADLQAVDLAPPKRYKVEAPLSDQPDDIVEEQDVSLNSYNGHFNSSFSEIENAGLDFVDVRLDHSGDTRSPPYGPGSHFASRSAIEIRQDSISSNSEAAKKVALEAEERERRIVREQHRYLHSRESSGSDDGHGSPMSRASPRRSTSRSVEGRYMGRPSRPQSRAASPERNGKMELEAATSSSSPSLPPVIDVAAIDATTLAMALAGDEGDVTSVPVSVVVAPGEQDQPCLSQAVDEEKEKETATRVKESQEEGKVGEEEEENTGKAHLEDTPPPTPATTEENDKGLSDVADKEQEKGKKKRRESSNKPSALEQHMSRTRMMNLPPKSKQEDVKHLQDYEEMMKLSKEKEEKKQQDLEDKRRQKDAELQENMKVWEKDILPSWTRARREVHLRKLWWKGIPPSIRGRLWALACGNNQMLPRNLYTKTSAEARQRIQQGTFPVGDLRALEADIEATLPSLKLFQRDIGALHDDLHSVLCALVIVRLDHHRNSMAKGKEKQTDQDDTVHVYQQGSASLAAMLMSNLTPSETLIALLNLIAERPWLQALFASSTSARGRKEDAAAFERVFDTLLADQMPKVYANMQARGVRPSAYVTTWVKTLFVPYLPFDLVARLWDCV